LTNIKEITENIFKLDKRIRYVAILNHQYDLLESRMREGVSSLTPAQTDRDFMTVAAPLIVDAAEKLRPFCGAIRRLAVRYDKVLLVFYRTTVHLVVLSLEPQVEQALLDEIGNSVRKLELASADGQTEEDRQ
jgi:flagellar motor component MotA